MGSPISRRLLFLLAHGPLGLAMHGFHGVATAHALATPVVGLLWASKDAPSRVASVAAYIAGAEVLWRMNEAGVFWEYGKYATAALLIVTMLRTRELRGSLLPPFYFALLLPSLVLTIANNPDSARNEISFNLSGPFALMVCAYFFSNLRARGHAFAREDLERIGLALVGPVVGIAALALFGTLTAPEVEFVGRSNYTTSGGYGPNQVAAMLGLAGLLSFLLVLVRLVRGRAIAVGMLAGALGFASLSALTFSRGGLYSAAPAGAVAIICLLGDRKLQKRAALVVALLLLVGAYIVVPRLNAFTRGALESRFEDTDTDGRLRFAQADLEVWKQHPWFGVGPGGASAHRASPELSSSRVAFDAHTEFSRALAEHGMAGLFSLLVLGTLFLRSWTGAESPPARALVGSLMCWSILFMAGNAMRIVAPSFLIGLSCARLLPEESPVILRRRPRLWSSPAPPRELGARASRSVDTRRDAR